MRIHRVLSSNHPEFCRAQVRYFFGLLVKGTVEYDAEHTFGRGASGGYRVTVRGVPCGWASDFFAACDMLMRECGLVVDDFYDISHLSKETAK